VARLRLATAARHLLGAERAVRLGARRRRPAVVDVVALRVRLPGVSGGRLVPEVLRGPEA
jgi:hypothetical protein